MVKFVVEIEEIQLLKMVDWTEKNPKEPIGFNTNSLCSKGVVEYLTNEYEGDYGIF